ncbi:FAD/NAD(P)-binding oxidoreductase, partial [Enterococcus faecalis]|uniref:NAD(P)/FAD-dependent oxidoreductase n=1 Tax=Enterococcus faecalis TaxID=1351 RepID=UPI00398474B5
RGTDADRLKSFLEEKNPQHVVILGAGVMGLELAENFKHRGLDVTLIDQLPQVAFPYDPEIADLVYDKLLKEGLAVHLETRVTEIRDKGREIVLSDGSVLSADMLIFAVGVSPNNEVV